MPVGLQRHQNSSAVHSTASRGSGAAGSAATFIMTVTIIPFMPDGWDPVAGFPAMTGNVPFLMKDVVLLAASIYLLKQDVERLGWL